MAKKYQQNRRDKLKEHFREHPYFKLCKTVFNEFQEIYPTMVMTPEQLFEDASRTLDRLLQDGDITTESCQSLWNDTYTKYREQDGTTGDKSDSKAEVTMLFYTVMYGLTTVNHSHYRGTLQRTLHECICKFYGLDKCLNIERKLREKVNQHTKEMLAWMEEYFISEQSLSNEIETVLHPQKQKPKKTPKAEDKTPYVLKYICNDETTRTNRLNRAMILMQNWNWIVEPNDADDFYDFFNGEHRACNLKWRTGKGGTNTTVLTLLIQSLYDQVFFEKQKGASVLAILKNQFGLKTVNYNFEERVSSTDKNRIALIIVVLNPDVKFKELPKGGYGDGLDYSDATMNAVYQKELHIIKDLNKWYE